jgi:hypothetical protein
MGRRDHFDDGHGREEFSIRIPQEDVALYRDIANMSRNQADMDRHMATRPVSLDDMTSLKQHLMTAHQMEPHELEHYDEASHDHIPSLANRSRDWSGDTVPALDHRDLLNMHSHDHTGEYAEDYPHSTAGNSHFHHD